MDVTHVPRIEELERSGWKNAGRPVHAMLISDSPRGEDMPDIAGRARRTLGADVPVLYLHYPKRPVPLRAGNETSVSKPFRAPDLWHALVSVIEPVQTGPECSSAVTGGQGDTGTHVLVAEDDAINAKLITSLLRKAGHRVTLVHDGEVALHTARDGKFDVVLVDLRMPRMDGIDFTRAYRSREPAGEHLPIVALTANAAEEAKAECLAAGMDEFLTKPVDPQVLDSLLRDLCRTA
jgi:two-component system sensor histidine kinase RpfC